MKQPIYQDKKKLVAALARHDGNNSALAFELGVSPSTVQKWRQKHGLPAMLPGSGSHQGAKKVPAPGDEVSREELLEREVRELRSRLAKGRKAEVTNAALVRVLEDLVPTIEPIYAPAEPVVDGAGTEHCFMLDWSDLHASEVVSSEQMNGINEYDWDVMLRRHDQMLKSIVSFKRKRPYPVRKLFINGLGDMLSGNIHPELKETNDRPLMEAALQLGMDMSEWVARLAEEFEEIEIHGVVGNHPRTTLKQGMKNRYDNYDWMVYQIMKLRLAESPHVTVEVPRSANTTVQVFGETHLLMHGDGIRSTMPGVPWGGVMRRVAEMTNQYARIGTPIRRFHVGHFHNPNIVEGGRILMNGSVKGPDEYSLLQFGGGHDASQLLQVYHPRRGLTETCILDLR
jgi:transposase-like protein